MQAKVNKNELSGKLDFGKYEFVDLYGADLSKVTYLKGAKNTDMAFAKGANGCLDFRNTKFLNMYYVNCVDVRQLYVNSCAEYVNLSCVENLYGTLNLEHVKQILLNNVDLSGVNLILNPNAMRVDLFGAEGLKDELDFSNVNNLDLGFSDLSKVSNIKFNPNAMMINLAGSKGLKNTLFFGNAKLVGFRNADLSGVRKIVCGQNTNLNHMTDNNMIEVIRVPTSGIKSGHLLNQITKMK